MEALVSAAAAVITVESRPATVENKSGKELHVEQGMSVAAKSTESVVAKSTEEVRVKQGNSATATMASTTAVAESPRVSKTVKAGLNFVIPKNKLSGAMVPVNRSTSKWEPVEPKKEELKPAPRKTKWGLDSTQDAVVKRGRALALQTRAEQIAAQLESGNLDIDSNEETRSPSPPPLYDTLGHRMNTREARKREQLDLERREAIGECMKLNTAYKPPSGFKPVAREAKLYIPVKEHPGYNFIGLILGPRGNTQKTMEAETGAKITIRGKGAVKEGKMQSARNGKDTDGAFEELHVHISADTFEKVDAAVAIIEPLLTPVDEDRNMHKMKQLRELAEMNGTLNDFMRACSMCGEAGHREWQCPKEKLQNFQAQVICRLCGDGGHPTIDCPLKSSVQGVTFDKEYGNFLEELGTGLDGTGTSETADHPSGANTSQPMLLTTLGAQPVPVRWMAPAIGTDPTGTFTPRGPPDGAVDTGAFPRFPNPLGSQGMNTSNPFLPRFFQPGGVPSGPLRGQPFPGAAFQMMGRMLSTFRGQFPVPPARLASSMGPPAPPIGPTGMRPHSLADNSMHGQTQAGRSADQGVLHANIDLFRGSQPASSTQDERKNTDGTNVVSAIAAAPFSLNTAAPSFPGAAIPGSANTVSPFQSSIVRPLPTFSPVATSVQPFPPTSTSNPVVSETARPALPLAPAHAVVPFPMIHPVRPVIPSIRPVLPTVRPMGPIAQQAPIFAGGPGQGLSNNVPSFGGTSSSALPPASNSFPRPPQHLPGAATVWGQGPYPRPPPSPQQVTSTPDKPFAPSHPFTPLSTHLPTSIRVLGPTPGAAPVQAQAIMRTPPSLNPSTQSPSFTPILPRTPQNQFVMTPNNQMAAQPLNHASPRPAFPPLLGPQMRAMNVPNAMLPVGGNPLLSSSIHHTAAPQRSILRQPQEMPRSSLLPNVQLSHQGNLVPRAELSPVRHPQAVLVGAQARAEFRNPGFHQPGILLSPTSILGSPGFNRPPIPVPSQEGYNSNFSRPVHAMRPFGGNHGAMNAPWDANMTYRNRPDMQQVHGQPGMVVNKTWNADPHMRPQLLNVPRPQMQEVDPEYEKLMASVGVL
eukprot:c24857_g1_i1 orf=143-3412(-)